LPWPAISLHQDLSIARHAGLREADGRLELQLDADDLFDPVVSKVRVFGGNVACGSARETNASIAWSGLESRYTRAA
jgi:hypothetical protein